MRVDPGPALPPPLTWKYRKSAAPMEKVQQRFPEQ
jgi:hypothetical protein